MIKVVRDHLVFYFDTDAHLAMSLDARFVATRMLEFASLVINTSTNAVVKCRYTWEDLLEPRVMKTVSPEEFSLMAAEALAKPLQTPHENS